MIDGIGSLMHGLFGLATDNEIDEIRHRIEENRRQSRAMSTWADEYMVVMNATHDDVTLNRALINNITQNVAIAIDLTHLILMLKDQMNQLEKGRRRTQEIRRDLEQGRLTERLFPRRLFRTMFIEPNEHWLPPEWYYRWCQVEPLWNQDHTYAVRLPLITHETTQGYELQSFPVWGPRNTTVRLRTSRYAVLNTATGLVSEPQRCIGLDPLVCDPGLVRQDSCAAAIVTQRDLKQDCEATLLHEVQTYVPLATNELVAMIPKDTTLRERCPDMQHPTAVQVSRGTQRIQWTEGCHLITESFSVVSIPVGVGHRFVKQWILPSNTTDLVRHFIETPYPSDLPPILPLNVHRIPPLSPITWQERYDWTVILFLIWDMMLSVGVVMSLCALFRHRCTMARTPDLEEECSKEEEPSSPQEPSVLVDQHANAAHFTFKA